jgi:hypothetical protein
MWPTPRTLLPGAVIFAIVVTVQLALPRPTPFAAPAGGSTAAVPLRSPDPSTDPSLASFVVELLAGGSPVAPSHPALEGDAGPTYVALRDGGLRLAEAWGEGSSRAEALGHAMASARSAARDAIGKVDAIEVSIGASVDLIDRQEEEGRLTNVHRGVLGLQVELNGEVARFAPTQMIANNLSFRAAMDRAAAALGVSDGIVENAANLSTFAAEQLLVTVDPVGLSWMFRGNELVSVDAVTVESAAALASGLGEWLTRNAGPDGRMTYLYWPSRGEESDANNTIRQWMATIALERVAAQRGEEAIHELAATNIAYNLATFYEREGELGLIVESDGDAKLGAAALAALAIIEHPQRKRFLDEERALRHTVDTLWQPDGSFRTFHRPVGRNDNQNFYPGEALLLWATLLDQEADPELHERFMASFRYYRDWHRQHRNPAFVPWHTQAYVTEWERTGDPELKAFVYEMNDWLLDVQQWEVAEYPDLQGRFYAPGNPEYGPPHAASDGVYLEGLVAAYRLAIADGDDPRSSGYRLAINRVLRNLMQLHFGDEIDRFYVSRPDPVQGGMRTTPYENEIRVDNVQHSLMGVLGVLQTFAPDDYSGAPEIP